MLREVWNLLTPRQRRWVMAAQVLSLVMAFCTVAGIAAIGPFFAVLGDPQSIDRSKALHWIYVELGAPQRRNFTVWLGAAFIVLVLLANVINLAGTFVLNRLAWSIGNELRSVLYAEYLNRPYMFHSGANSSVLVNNVIHETRRVTSDVLQDSLTLVTNAITAVLIVLSVLILDAALALTMLGMLAGGYLLIFAVVRSRLAHWGRLRSHCIAEQTRIGNESFGAIREVLTFGLQTSFRNRFERAGRAASLAAAHIYAAGQSPRYVMECVAVLGLVAAALVLGGGSGGSGVWLGQLTFLGFAAYRLLPTLQQVFAAAVRISAARPTLTTLAPDIRLARDRMSVDTQTDSSWQGRPRREIRFKDVSFRYGSDRPWTLEQVSFRIRAGTATAFVGANGSGKTTAADLIAGLLDASAGEIEIDGIALDAGNRRAWQARIAYVPQEVFLLDTTIAHNIALGVPAADLDRERLQAAVRLAQLDDLIRTLPGGLDYRVGEHAVRLSGGQRQRIGIARALYKEAAVLILDEATSALDSAAEQEWAQTLMGLRGRYTTIVISHQLRTAQMCDSIFEFGGGKVVDGGTCADRFASTHVHRTA